MRLRLLVLLSLLTAGCVSSQPNPQLVQAARHTPDTPTTVSGALASACLAEQRFLKSVSLSDTGTYSPNLTYAFAEKMPRVAKDGAVYAPRIRAYEFRAQGANVFGGKVDATVACCYELRDGQLRYLATLSGNRDDRVDRYDRGRALSKAYAIMSGKSGPNALFWAG